MAKIHLPLIPISPMYVDDVMAVEWQNFFRNLYTRIGGIEAPTNLELEKLGGTEIDCSAPKNYGGRIAKLEQIISSGVYNPTIPIRNKEVKDYNIDWGYGAGQVSSDDIPDHDGHTVKDTFDRILNRGKLEPSTITLTGGLGISWIEHEIYDDATDEPITISAGSGTLTDNVVNYLKWVSGTTATIATSTSSGDEILLAVFSTYGGNINSYRETSTMNETIANTRRGVRVLHPTHILSGMIVHEDTDATNPLDVTMDAGVFWKDAIEEKTPAEIKSRTTAMVRHYHVAGAWSHDTNAQIDTAKYDDGTDLVAIPSNKYVKALFIYMNGKIGWVYPTTYYTVEAHALEASLPAVPPGLQQAPILTAIVYQQGDTDFADAVWQDVRPGISERSFNAVTNHAYLSNLEYSVSGHTGFAMSGANSNITTMTGLNDRGIPIAKIENVVSADATLSDTPKVFTLYDDTGVAYYFKAYPTKT